MRSWLAWVMAATIAATAEAAPDGCALPQEQAFLDSSLPTTARRLKAGGELRVVVFGTALAAGVGVSSTERGFPARLLAYLHERRGADGAAVVVKAYSGVTTKQMAERILDDIMPQRPDVVIWQTGTVDAVRGTDINDFGDALSAGVALLRGRRIDVILVNPQFGSRISATVDMAPYLDYMERIADMHDVVLFRRWDAMRTYANEGRVKLDAVSREKQQAAADWVHDCIGRLLAHEILTAKPEP
ncbi:MAG: hypothetical protein FJX46_06765 [Alphaproteobacteria bacterium]|nr:hypothetical protein [Alphaproteobacteria bacterium]